jgi:streptogramin lyase
MGLLLVSGVNRYVSRRLVRLRGVLAAILGDVGGHLPLGALIALALGVAAMLALSAAAARGAPRLVPDGQFESEGALGIAVNLSTSESDASRGDVYVAGFVTDHVKEGSNEFVPGRVNKFTPSGGLLTPPSPIGAAQFSYSGVAVNPVNGDVYALDALASEIDKIEIDKYDPTSGELISAFPVVPPSNNFSFFLSWTVVGIATDSTGNVYVPVVPSNEVLEYSPTGELLKTFTGGSGAGALKGPTGVSVDPSGNVWVGDAGNERIEELSPADNPIREINSEGVQAVAVDSHDDVFATVHNSADFCGKIKPPCSHLVEYSSTGAQLADLGAGSIGAQAAAGAVTPLPNMVAVSNSSGRVYVTEGLSFPQEGVHGRVFKFTPPVAPKLESELAVEVGSSEATLGAVVNPGGIGAAYRFEYGTTVAYGHVVPFPEGDTGGGFHSRSVWASALELQAGTTYHYRVVISSELGEPLVGKDQTFTTETAAQVACPNEQFRTGFSASLPDCRAYELVTPPNKSGAAPDRPREGSSEESIEAAFEYNFAGVDGSRMSFNGEDVFPGSTSAGQDYVATRGPRGWSLENMFPPMNYYGFECPDNLHAKQYSADLSRAILQIGGGECGGPEPELVSGEPKDVENVFVRDNTDGSYQLVNMPPPGMPPTSATSAAFAGASADLSHVVFEEQAKLTPDALNGASNVYEWNRGVVRLLTVLADGTPVAGSLAAISHDGSRIFFTSAGNLYARVNGTTTVKIDASQTGGPGGGGSFVAVSADGSQVLFTDDASAGLTSDTTPDSGRNLYKYDFASGRVSDLTPAAHAEVQSFLGVSEDGSYVYFKAQGSLAAGATQGQPNLYVWHAGGSAFIAALAKVPFDEVDEEYPKVSANGAFLAFASSQSLTGYDNTDANTGKPDREIYVYAAAANSLACASCNPSGTPSTSGPRWGSGIHLSPRNLSEDGRVFFDTREALLPADTNDRRDVYEFEPDGVGSCSNPSGCVFLISAGTGGLATWFIDASPSGNDVFMLEFQNLVRQDIQEEARVIYDVRVNGGIPEPATQPPCTTADACRAAPAQRPSTFGAPASQTFSGAGNLALPPPTVTKCKKGFVKKKGKCTKKPRRKTKHAHTRRKAKRAHTNTKTGK